MAAHDPTVSAELQSLLATMYREFNQKVENLEEKLAQKIDDMDRRIDHLCQSVENYMQGATEFQGNVMRAFPKDEDGKPDVDGHRSAHIAWKKNSEESKEFWTKVKLEIAKWAAVLILGWAGVLLWSGLLHGPQADTQSGHDRTQK